MNYCIVENGIITNIIVCDAEFAESIGALIGYDSAKMGDEYVTPTPEPPEPDPPTWDEDVDAMLVDHELRLSMLELGVDTSDTSDTTNKTESEV